MTLAAPAKPRLLLACLALAAWPATAHASPGSPTPGTFTAKNAREAVAFDLRRTRGGYQARSTRVALTARCSSNSEDATQDIRARGVTVSLKRSGGRLKGTRRYEYFDPDQATVIVRIGITFTGSNTAEVTLRATYGAEEQRDGTGTDDCTRRLTLTARHS